MSTVAEARELLGQERFNLTCEGTTATIDREILVNERKTKMAHKLSRILDYLPMKRDIERSDLEWLRNVAETAENAAPVVNGKVPAKYIPEYFNDIQDYPAKSDFPETGETGKFYVDSSDGSVYRWDPAANAYKPSPDPLTADVANLKARGYVKDGSGTVVAVVGSGSGSEVELQAKLTIDSEPTSGSDNPVSSGGVKAALANVDAKPTRIYNETGTDALDDKGQMFKSSDQGNYFDYGGDRYYFSGTQTINWGGYRTAYYYARSGMSVSYYYFTYNNRGILAEAGSNTERSECAPNINPTVVGADIAPVNTAFVFTPLSVSMETTPYAHFALEALPDRTWAAGVWAVSDLVKYSGKAYRCKSAATSSDTTAPSSDSAHWDEVPVLAQKAGLPDYAHASADSASSLNADVVTALTGGAVSGLTFFTAVGASCILYATFESNTLSGSNITVGVAPDASASPVTIATLNVLNTRVAKVTLPVFLKEGNVVKVTTSAAVNSVTASVVPLL